MKQTNQQKSEKENWEKEFDERFDRFYIKKSPKEQIIDIESNSECFVLGSDDIKDFIRQTIAQSRQQFAEEIEEIIQQRKEYHQRMGTDIEFHNGGVSACVSIKQIIRANLTKEKENE